MCVCVCKMCCVCVCGGVCGGGARIVCVQPRSVHVCVCVWCGGNVW